MQSGCEDTCFVLHIVDHADAMTAARLVSSSQIPAPIMQLRQLIGVQVREVPAGHPARTLGGIQGRSKEFGVYARKVRTCN